MIQVYNVCVIIMHNRYIYEKSYQKKKDYMKTITKNQEMCCDDVIKYLYNLNKLDIKVYKTLSKTKELKTNDLANQLNKERSTIYRSLQRLSYCGLCKKKTKTLKKGGYYYIYEPVKKNEIKKNLESCIELWSQKMKTTLKEL